MALDDKDIKQINEMIGAGVTAAVKPLTESITAVAGTVKGLTEGDNSVAALVTKSVTEAVAKLAPKPEDKDKGGAGGTGGTLTLEAVKAAITETVAPLVDWKKKLEEEGAAKTARQTALDLASKWIGEKYAKLPKAAQGVIAERIAAKLPKDAAAVEAEFKAINAEYASLGIKVESITANPAAEGAKDAAPNADKVKEQIERIDKAPVGTRI